MQIKDVEIQSSPIVDLGPVPETMLADLSAIAQTLPPNGDRKGQVSAQITIGRASDRVHPLYDFAVSVGEQFLGEQPGDGSDVRLKYVTDAQAFANDEGRIGAATFWHHDYRVTQEEGFSFLQTTRLVIPTERGTWADVGTLVFPNAAVVDAEEALRVGRNALLSSKHSTVIGVGGVLVKSDRQPIGGKISLTKPNRGYVIPGRTVHKADRDLPTGRILFRMDARLRG